MPRTTPFDFAASFDWMTALEAGVMGVCLSGEELLRWNDVTFTKWMDLVERQPAVMGVPCDIRETSNVGELLHHIAMVELRYAERLADEPETEYQAIPVTVDAIRSAHDGMVRRLRRMMADDAYPWDEVIAFRTRSLGMLQAERRTVLVHLLMHGIRHYAQAATLARKAGFGPDWPMDYLFMEYCD